MAKTLLNTSIVTQAEGKFALPLTGGDYFLIIDGYEDLVFDTQTFTKIGFKSESVAYTGLFGVKHERAGVVQTLNEGMSISFIQREGLTTKQRVEDIIASSNGDISGTIYAGINLDEAVVHSKFISGHFKVDDNGEADVEGGGSPDKVTYTMSCHYKYEKQSITANVLSKIRTLF